MRSPSSSISRRHLVRRLKDRAPTPSGAGGDGISLGSLLRATRPAMGTSFEIVMSAGVPGASQLACQALDRIDQLESQMTVYRQDSELSLLNATAHEHPVAVEPGLFDLLRRARAVWEQTGGAYDISAGALSRAWGFTFGPKRVPDPEQLAEARSRTGMHLVKLDDTAGTVAFDLPGIQLNLGSIGKGYAIDQAVEVVRNHWWPTSALVHGGHSSVYALGSPPMTMGGRWKVALRNPFQPERPLGSLRLRDRAMGTSGAVFQQFEEGGRFYGHILDPRTGEPLVDGPESMTVLAPSAADADALSTAFSLIGVEATESFLSRRSDVAAIFVLCDKSGRNRRLVSINVRDYEFSPDVAILTPIKNDPGRRLRVYQIAAPSSRASTSSL